MPFNSQDRIIILVADDDEEDQDLIKKAIKENNKKRIDIIFVNNGEELLDYLFSRGIYKNSPRPHIILLDLKMPKKGGIETLQEIKREENFKNIPIIALSSSSSEKDINRSYKHGANSYIVKPNHFSEMVKAMDDLDNFWFETAELPVVTFDGENK